MYNRKCRRSLAAYSQMWEQHAQGASVPVEIKDEYGYLSSKYMWYMDQHQCRLARYRGFESIGPCKAEDAVHQHRCHPKNYYWLTDGCLDAFEYRSRVWKLAERKAAAEDRRDALRDAGCF